MSKAKFDHDKAAKVLVSVVELGSERRAAEHWKVSERTVRNYKRRLDTDPALAASFRKLSALTVARLNTERAQAEIGWRRESHATLRAILDAEKAVCERLIDLVKTCEDIELLAKVAGRIAQASERIGQLDVAREALGVGGANHQPSSSTAEDAADPEGGSEGGSG